MRSKNNIKIASGQLAMRGTELFHVTGVCTQTVPGDDKPSPIVYLQPVALASELEILIPPAPKPEVKPEPKPEEETD